MRVNENEKCQVFLTSSSTYGNINNIPLTNAIYKHIEGEVRKMLYIPSALSNGLNTPGLLGGAGSLVQQLLPECIKVVMTTLERIILETWLHTCVHSQVPGGRLIL